MSDDHSGVEPLLPISNRTVKRASADDSRVRPGESRSSSDTPPKARLALGADRTSADFEAEPDVFPPTRRWGFMFVVKSSAY